MEMFILIVVGVICGCFLFGDTSPTVNKNARAIYSDINEWLENHKD